MRPILALAALASLAAGSARAGPAHVLASKVLAPSDGAYAVSPDLDDATRAALAKGLHDAGLAVVPADAPHALLVTVQAQAAPICTRNCSPLVQHDDGRLDDYYRHVAVVVAQPNAGARFDRAATMAWFTVLQSDGLSGRRGDYLPALLRYGSQAYGRATTPQPPPVLPPRLTTLPPNVIGVPSA